MKHIQGQTNLINFTMLPSRRFCLVIVLTILLFISITSGQQNTNNTNGTGTGNGNGNGNTSPTETEGTGTRPNCSANETLAESGQDCLTCGNPTASCPLITESRCFCNSGYVRNASNTCILPADCSPQAGCYPNATRSSISSNCFTCDNYRTATCPLSTADNCYCNNGYVLDLDNNRCVFPSDCPVYSAGECRANQTFSDRGYDCDTCINYQTNGECPVSFQSRCYCNVGFVRDVSTQRCIRQQDCNTAVGEQCAPNQTMLSFGYDCSTCANPNRICKPTSERRCYCLNGYVRTSSGDCIQPQDCFRPNLPAGATCRDPWSVGCNPECVPTCRRRETGIYQPGSLLCRAGCAACYCPSGQVRNGVGVCIPVEQCFEYPYNFPHFRYSFK